MTTIYITSGQAIPGGTITAGNTLDVISGGTATSPTVIDGGFAEVFGGGTAIGPTVSAGLQRIDADGSLAGATINGGTLELVAADSNDSGTVVFAGGGAVQVDTGIPGFVISGFHAGDSVDFRAVSPAATSITETLIGAAVNGVTFAGIATSGPGAPHLNPDGAGGTLVTVACFAAGTSILTASGETTVESLRPGDHVVAVGPAGARLRPVRWIGQRTLAPARHPRPRDVMPVRIRACAFGPARPHRDLVLSPDHCLYLDGILVPVRLLVDGERILQQQVETVTYHHVELFSHDVLLAENLPCETYLDTGNRACFENEIIISLHPDFAAFRREAAACARLEMSVQGSKEVCSFLQKSRSQAATVVTKKLSPV